MNTHSPEGRLKELNIRLPDPPEPVANFVPVVRSGNLLFLSGQGPTQDGVPVLTGKVGADLSEKEAYQAARLCILNSLAVVKAEVGDLGAVKRIVKLLGFVASAPGFARQPYIINGASDLLAEVFGERGRHARSALGTSELPFNIPVEIEMIVEV